jgi:hypothetical protein
MCLKDHTLDLGEKFIGDALGRAKAIDELLGEILNPRGIQEILHLSMTEFIRGRITVLPRQPNSGGPISEFAEQLVGIMGKHFSLTHHLNGNILIDFVDQDHANTETYFRAFHLTRADMKPEDAEFIIGARRLAELSHVDGNVYDIVVGGRYLDQVERRDGIWKIKLRQLIFDYCTVLPSSTLHAGGGMIALGAATMARDRSDPSYST